MAKLRIGVLMGGKSIEREVSFNSGRTICDHLDTQRYTIIPIFQTITNELFILPWHFLHRGKISDFEARLYHEAQSITWDALKNRVDLIYIAMHGRYAEDGTMQGFLDLLGIPYVGSKIMASALSMNKAIQKKFLAAHTIATPRGVCITVHNIHNRTLITELLEKAALAYPLIVKPIHEGSSLGVQIVHSNEQLLAAVQHACFINPTHPQPVLIEEKIEGMEFSCVIITDYNTGQLVALPPTEVVADAAIGIFDYEQKYMPGRATEFTPARCDDHTLQAIKQTCIATMRALGLCNLARIDGFVKKDGTIIIVDPNSFSGMAPASFCFREAAHHNLSHTQLINHLIETELHACGMLNQTLKQEKKESAMETQKIRVGILMGGPSNEREISLESGRNVTYKLSPHKYEAIPIFVSNAMELFPLSQQLLVLNSTQQIEQALDHATRIDWHNLPQLVDFVFIGLHAGPGENGAVQGTLQMLGIPYNGSGVLTSSLCMDKFKTNQFLAAQGFDVPAGILISKLQGHHNELQTYVEQAKMKFPLIVKPHDDGCSVMVQKVYDEASLQTAVEIIFAHGKEYALIEECIQGMELTVGVVGNESPKALPPSQAVCAADILSIEEKFLPGDGENQTPAPLPKEALLFVQNIIEKVFKTIDGKGYARIDCFYQNAAQSKTGKERVVILEINTLPGLTPATCIFHQAAEIGIKPMDFIDMIVTLGLQGHSHTAGSTTPAQSKQENL